MTRLRRPDGLGARARAYWDWAVSEFGFSRSEAQVLIDLVRTIDRCDRLDRVIRSDGATFTDDKGNPKMHPAVAELRLTEAHKVKLTVALSLPEESPIETPRTKAARKAAQTRWNEEKKRRGIDAGASQR